METLIASVLLIAVPAALIYGAYRVVGGVVNRGQELNQLVRKGTAVTGYIKELAPIVRNRQGFDKSYLTDQFQDASGQEHSRRLKVFSRQYVNYSQGDAIDIVYLRERPQVNATREIVDEMRQGMEKHGQISPRETS